MSDSLRPHESQHARPPCPYSLFCADKILVSITNKILLIYSLSFMFLMSPFTSFYMVHSLTNYSRYSYFNTSLVFLLKYLTHYCIGLFWILLCTYIPFSVWNNIFMLLINVLLFHLEELLFAFSDTLILKGDAGFHPVVPLKNCAFPIFIILCGIYNKLNFCFLSALFFFLGRTF